MKVVLHDHTAGLGPELRKYAQTKLTRLARHFGRVAEAEVVFSEERKRSGLATSVCRIVLHIDGRRAPLLSAQERGADPQSALDLALDKIDRQVVKLKEMRTQRKKPASAVRVPAEAPARRDFVDEPERIRMRLRPMSIGQAVDALEADGQSFHVFLNEDSGEISIAYRRSDGSVAVIEPVVP